MAKLPAAGDHREAAHDIDPIFINRWSPRAMSGAPVTQAELDRMFEAARWAPSSYNEQPWRFLYAHRHSEHFEKYFGFLFEANQAWCKTAGVLVVIAVHTVFTKNGKPNAVAVFDCGSAWENLALQGAKMGLVTHGMAGFDRNKASGELKLPPNWESIAMIAIGRPGDPDKLPEEMRKAEVPSSRKPIGEIAFPGLFPQD